MEATPTAVVDPRTPRPAPNPPLRADDDTGAVSRKSIALPSTPFQNSLSLPARLSSNVGTINSKEFKKKETGKKRRERERGVTRAKASDSRNLFLASKVGVYKKKEKRGFSNVNALESREGSLKSERQEREEEIERTRDYGRKRERE